MKEATNCVDPIDNHCLHLSRSVSPYCHHQLRSPQNNNCFFFSSLSHSQFFESCSLGQIMAEAIIIIQKKIFLINQWRGEINFTIAETNRKTTTTTKTVQSSFGLTCMSYSGVFFFRALGSDCAKCCGSPMRSIFRLIWYY